MALTTAQKTDLYRFFVIAFDAAPGVTYMNQLATAADSGMSIQQIVNEFTKKPEFTNFYFNFLTNQEFAQKFVDNNVASTTTAAAKQEAVDQIVAGLNSGLSRGDVIFNVFNNLAGLTNDAKWGDTAKLLNNQVTYAQYYTETLGLGAEATPSIPALRNVIKNVTATSPTDAGSIAAALNPVSGLTFNLTTGIDNLQPGPGNDTYTGTAGTWNTGDVVNGGDGTDTLNATVSGAGPTLTAASLVSVEVLNVTASPNPVTLSLTGVTGLQQVNNLSSANGASLTVTGLGNAVNTTITGGNTLTSIGYGTAVTASTATTDAATVTLAGVNAGSSFTTSGIETLTVNSTTAANTATLTATGVTKLVVTGDQALNTGSTAVGGATIASVDASAATGAITLITGAGAGGTAATGVTVTAPTAATAGTFTITTGGNKDTVVLGAGASVVSTGAGDDTITSGGGANTITPGGGNDTVILGAGVDTVRFDAAAASGNVDTISGFDVSKDVVSINLGTAQAGTTPASAVYGTLATGATSPTFAGVSGTGTGTAIVLQSVAAGSTTANTIAQASNVVVLNGAFTDGTSAGVVTALGATGADGVTTAAGSRFLLVTYSVGNIAQVWSYTGDTGTVDTNINSTELQLVATLNNVASGSLTAANFSTYLAAATTGSVVSNAGQTIALTGLLNTVQNTANSAGQFLTAANDTINVAVGTMPTAAATATSGLVIIDSSSTDADVMNATVLGDWALGSVISGIETINLNMLVPGTAFSAAAKTPGTTQFGLTGTQNFTVTALPNGGGVTLGAGYTGDADINLISTTGTSDAIVVNLAGSTATSNAVGSSVKYTVAVGGAVETATVNVSANSSIRLAGTGLLGTVADVTAVNLAGSGNLTVFGAPAGLDTAALNASGIGYTGALTLAPGGAAAAAMDFSATGVVSGIRTIDFSNVTAAQQFAAAQTITLPAVTGGASLTIANAPASAIVNMTGLTVAQGGSALNDAMTVSMGANASGNLATGGITATGTETLTITSAAASTTTTGINGIALFDGVGNQTVTVTGAGNFTLGNVVADSLTTTGVTGTVTASLTQTSGGAVFSGGAGATTITGSAGGDVITTGAGNDSVTGGRGADSITLGVGTDTVLLAESSLTGAIAAVTAQADSITGFQLGTGNDKLNISTAFGYTAEALSTGNSNAIAATGAAVVQSFGSTGGTLGATTNVIVLTTTFATSTAMLAAIGTGGSAISVGAVDPTNNADYIVIWTDGVNSHVGVVRDADAAGAAAFVTADLTYAELALLVGVASVSGAVNDNFGFIAP